MKNLAVVCNTGLGDAILFERIAHALSCSGKNVYVYGHYLDKFKRWFPSVHFELYPSDIENPTSEFWIKHEGYIFQEYAPGSHVKKENSWILGENYRKKNQSWRDHQAQFLLDVFHMQKPKLLSSMKPLDGLCYRKNSKRIILHPTSLKEEKNWPAEKFIQLAQNLALKGYQPFFCVGENEKEIWESYLKKSGIGLLVSSLDELSAIIYESGYFIGNDSGISHLASALDIPSLKIFDRASRARFWSGGWDLSKVVTPWPLPTRALRVKYWKVCLSVARVEKAFYDLVRNIK